jgi:hypothetical protein
LLRINARASLKGEDKVLLFAAFAAAAAKLCLEGSMYTKKQQSNPQSRGSTGTAAAAAAANADAALQMDDVLC